jgi:hypothetical protein
MTGVELSVFPAEKLDVLFTLFRLLQNVTEFVEFRSRIQRRWMILLPYVVTRV